MSTRASSRFLAAYVAVLLVVGSGCSLLSKDDDEADPSAPVESPGVQLTDAPPDTLTGLTKTLERRADAVRESDETAFLAGLVKGDADFTAQQTTYFENLAQLPISTFAYTIDQGATVRQGESYWVVVDLALQLDGFDAEPVVSQDRYLLTPGQKPGRFRLASVTDLVWEAENEVQQQPWDVDAIEVVKGAGVLGIFDRGSVRAARPLVRSVERGISDVAGVVPSSWSQTVVVYALSNTAFLATLPGLPGDDPSALDGVAFPVFATPQGGNLVATRFVLHPRMLDERGRARDRLVRHELTHVAIGQDDDRAPVWLSEGLAEYVSVQPLPPEKRTISGAAIDAARAGVTDMPSDDSFKESGTLPRTSANYGIAWFACEYLASSYGEVTLWQLLAALNAKDADPDQVLMSQLGINLRTLARKAGKLILTTYDMPDPEPTELPTETPTDGVPTDGAPTETPGVQPTATPTA